MKRLLSYIHQLPQNLVALCILAMNHNNAENCCVEGVKVHFVEKGVFKCGVSLGNYILLHKNYKKRKDLKVTVMHEHGHQIQSLYLGWMYLMIIGILSASGNMIDRIFHKKWDYESRIKWYYNQPWEKWADKLGGVKR